MSIGLTCRVAEKQKERSGARFSINTNPLRGVVWGNPRLLRSLTNPAISFRFRNLRVPRTTRRPPLSTPPLSRDGWDGLGRSWDARKSENRPCLPALGRWDGCTPSKPPLPPRLCSSSSSSLCPNGNQLHLSTLIYKSEAPLSNPSHSEPEILGWRDNPDSQIRACESLTICVVVVQVRYVLTPNAKGEMLCQFHTHAGNS